MQLLVPDKERSGATPEPCCAPPATRRLTSTKRRADLQPGRGDAGKVPFSAAEMWRLDAASAASEPALSRPARQPGARHVLFHWLLIELAGNQTRSALTDTLMSSSERHNQRFLRAHPGEETSGDDARADQRTS